MPPPNWLRAFEVAARHCSFTAAARELSVTPAAVSQQIRLLEHHLGEPLFQRLPRRLALTPAGTAYLKTVSEAFARIAAGTDEIFSRARGALVTVRADLAYSALWLAPRLAGFHAAHPEIELRFSHDIWAHTASEEVVDLEIRSGFGQWPGQESRCLGAERLFPVCAPELAAGLRQPADLIGQTLIEVIGNAAGWAQWLCAAELGEPDLRRGPRLDTSVVALVLAERGLGVMLARSPLAARALAEGRLVAPFALGIDSDEAYHLLHPAHRELSPGARLFHDWLLAESAL